MTDEQSTRLLARYKNGDEQAAAEIFDRYLHRLIALARSRLSNKLAGKMDPEDVVQSAFRSFFRGVDDGRLDVHESGKLWPLLAKITLFKVYRQAERYGCAKKNVNVEQGLSGLTLAPEEIAREPTPSEVSGITEELQNTLAQLSERERQILELNLQGHDVAGIARQVSRSTRTVRRTLAKVEDQLTDQLLSAAQGEESR